MGPANERVKNENGILVSEIVTNTVCKPEGRNPVLRFHSGFGIFARERF